MLWLICWRKMFNASSFWRYRPNLNWWIRIVFFESSAKIRRTAKSNFEWNFWNCKFSILQKRKSLFQSVFINISTSRFSVNWLKLSIKLRSANVELVGQFFDSKIVKMIIIWDDNIQFFFEFSMISQFFKCLKVESRNLN